MNISPYLERPIIPAPDYLPGDHAVELPNGRVMECTNCRWAGDHWDYDWRTIREWPRLVTS